MPVNAALTVGELANLNNGPSTVSTNLSVVANAVYATADVLSAPNFPVAGLAVTNTSADWLTVPADASVKITDSTGSVTRGYYRTRFSRPYEAVTTAGILFINEIGQGDPGLLPQDIRVTAIQPGDKIIVYRRWDGWGILPRIVYSGTIGDALIFEDFDKLYSNENQYPGPATAIIIKRNSDGGNGMPGAWAWRVDNGHSYAELEFRIIDYEWPSAGAVSFLATVPGAWTVTGGSVATNTFIARVPAQADNYTLTWVVSEANGGVTVRHIPIWVYDFVTYFPIRITEVQNYSKDRTGARVALGLNDNRLASIPDGTLVCLWDESLFNGVVVPSASRFVNGFVTRVSNQMSPGLRGAELEIVGPGYLLQSINANSQYFTAVAGTPTNGQEITTLLSYLDFIVYWIMSRRTTLLYVFDYVPLGTPATTWKMPAWNIPTGTVRQQVQALAQRICGNFGSDAAGQFVLRQHPSVTTYATRGANVVTRDVWTAANYHDAPAVRELKAKYRKTRGEGFLSDGVTATAVLSDAPDTVPGQGPAEDKLPSQCVINQDELNERTGNWWVLQNNPYTATTEIPRNRDVIEPTHMQFVNETVPAYLDPYGVGYTKNLVPIRISKKYAQGGGYADITAESEFETAGLPGKSISVVVPDTTIFGGYSALPITLSLPPPPSGWGPEDNFVPAQFVIQYNGTGLQFAVAWRDTGGTWHNISYTPATIGGPTGNMIQDPYNYNRLICQGGAGFLLIDDWLTSPIYTECFLDPGAISPTTQFEGLSSNQCSGVQGSISRKGYFGWVAQDYTNNRSYYCYTEDYFATYHGVYSGLGHSITDGGRIQFAIYPFNGGNSSGLGRIFYNVHGLVVRISNDWGATWVTVSSGIASDGGNGDGMAGMSIPYSLRGGGNNIGPQFWQFYKTHGKMARLLGLAATLDVDVSTDTNATPWTREAINSFTLDGNYLSIPGNAATKGIVISNDGGSSWSNPGNAGFAFGAGDYAYGINGWPTNKNFMLSFGITILNYSVDRGANWTQIDTTPLGLHTVFTAFADLSVRYPNGGVHP